MLQLKASGMGATDIAKQMGIGRSTVYKILKEEKSYADSVTLYRIDPARNMQRFYRLDIQPDLFGNQCLIREWGRIGRPARFGVSPTLPEMKRSMPFIGSVRQRSKEDTTPSHLRHNSVPYYTFKDKAHLFLTILAIT